MNLIQFQLAFSVRFVLINGEHINTISDKTQDKEGGDFYREITVTNGRSFKVLDDSKIIGFLGVK